MYQRKSPKEYACTVDFALDVFGGKWKPRLLCILGHNQQMRYHDLKTQMATISDAALADNLKALQHDGLILRTQYNEMPIRVEYQLSPLGKTVLPILDQLSNWAAQHASKELFRGKHFQQVHARQFE